MVLPCPCPNIIKRVAISAQSPSPIANPIGNTLEVACFSSTAAGLAYLACMIVGGQPMIPIEIDGEFILVPEIVLEIFADLRNFGIKYHDAINRIHDKRPPLPNEKYELLLQANGRWQIYVHFIWLVVSRFA